MIRFVFSAAALVLITAPASAQSSWPATIGSTPAPALGITPGITLGIAAAATANDRPARSTTGNTTIAANTSPTRLRSSTR